MSLPRSDNIFWYDISACLRRCFWYDIREFAKTCLPDFYFSYAEQIISPFVLFWPTNRITIHELLRTTSMLRCSSRGRSRQRLRQMSQRLFGPRLSRRKIIPIVFPTTFVSIFFPDLTIIRHTSRYTSGQNAPTTSYPDEYSKPNITTQVSKQESRRQTSRQKHLNKNHDMSPQISQQNVTKITIRQTKAS